MKITSFQSADVRNGRIYELGDSPLEGGRGVLFAFGQTVMPSENTPLAPLKGGISSGSPKLWVRPLET